MQSNGKAAEIDYERSVSSVLERYEKIKKKILIIEVNHDKSSGYETVQDQPMKNMHNETDPLSKWEVDGSVLSR